MEVDKERVDYIDVSPRMMVSIATAMIPFLPNDDANRALMGANMQRQAVPLLRPHAPIVGTGMEHKICIDSEIVVLAEGDGVVTSVDARHITVKYDSGEVKDYKLTKFLRSNHTTCINQRPIVNVGERVHERETLADGPATEQGEIALGQNILMGFMTWEGYNYEDAVLLNERMVQEDVFTSIHIEEYETEARDTKLGPEEITRDIPNVGEDALKDLDEHGIIRVGAEVQVRRHPGGQGHPQGRDRPHRRGAAAAGHLRREGPGGPRHLSEGAPRRERHHTWTSRSLPGRTATSWAPASIRWSACISPSGVRSRWATRWQAATATRASSPACCPRRICPSCPTARRWTSC